ncbi:MAG: T9SS type A sorting domain-containing protein [Bacteroidetes bacterium]|nr:T9SS type A sorting domain-containing protein [Bacteroidota bacterium]
MKTKLTFFSLFFLVVFGQLKAVTKTTTSNGLWTNPSIWSPVGVPDMTDDIIIDHQVILDETVVLNNTSFLIINASGSLTKQQNDTLILGVEKVQVHGTLHVGVLFFGMRNIPTDTLLNTGILQVDDVIISQSTIVNTGTGKICANVFSHSQDFLTNDGSISAMAFFNTSQVSGSGKFCINFSFQNYGYIGGTVDICDATPSAAYDSSGVIAATVTFCQNGPCASCSASTTGFTENNLLDAEIFPNPMIDFSLISIPDFHQDGLIEIYNVQGELVRSIAVSSSITTIYREALQAGVYLCRIQNGQGMVTTKKLVVQ